MVGCGEKNHIRWRLVIVLRAFLFVRRKTSRLSIVRFAESRIVRLNTRWLTVWTILWKVSLLSRWWTRAASIVSPVSILIVGRCISRSISIASVEWLIWALVIWSSIVRMVVHICGVWSRKKLLTSSGGIARKPIVSIVLVSSFEILASNPSLWSIVWSSFFVVVLSQRDFSFGISVVFDSILFFGSYLFAAPTWGMTICAAVVAKSCCILCSFLVWVYCSRISFYNIN